MRSLICLLISFFITFPAWAYDIASRDALLNRVIVKLSAEQWVTTKSVLVSIGVNASLNDAGLEKIQDDVLKKLSQLSSAGEWHIISFDRSLDQSGLEKVQIAAQARLPTAALTNLRDKAKNLSKPGVTFTLDNVQFTPSQDEIRAANVALRSDIYQQAKEEVDHLNKLYPDQRYYVHEVDFVGEIVTAPMPQVYMSGMKVAGSNSMQFAVGDKLLISATTVLASVPDHGLIKNIT